jgi:DNA polymerase III subunit delta
MIFLLYGPDSFRAHQKLAGIREKFLLSQPSFNLAQINITELKSPDELSRLFQSATLLGGKRLVIVSNLLSLGSPVIKEEFVKLAKQNLPEDLTVVVFEGLEFDKRQAGFKLLNQPKTAQCFEVLSGSELLAFAKHLSSKKQLTIDPPLLQRVVSLVGGDLWRLENELNKLSAYSATRPLSSEVVRDLVSANLVDNLFSLMDAVAGRNPSLANRLLADLLQGGEDPIGLIAILSFQFRNLILIKSLVEQRKTSGDIIRQTGLHPYAVSNSIKQAGKFSSAWLIAGYQRLVVLDWKIKSGELAPADALDHFLVTAGMSAT